jgi:hypothetical protein
VALLRAAGLVVGRSTRALAAGACLILACSCASRVPSHVRSLTEERLVLLRSDPAVTDVARLFGPQVQSGTSFSCDGGEDPPRTWVQTNLDVRSLSATLPASIESAGWTPWGQAQTQSDELTEYFTKSFGSWTSIMNVSLAQTGGQVTLYTTQSDTCYGWLRDTLPSPSSTE